jgi:hypothetical protein
LIGHAKFLCIQWTRGRQCTAETLTNQRPQTGVYSSDREGGGLLAAPMGAPHKLPKKKVMMQQGNISKNPDDDYSNFSKNASRMS